MRYILEAYCRAPGQRVNLDKSYIFFSSNTPTNLREDLCNMLEVKNENDPGSYLGLPVL